MAGTMNQGSAYATQALYGAPDQQANVVDQLKQTLANVRKKKQVGLGPNTTYLQPGTTDPFSTGLSKGY
jgi:hypothetical protein